MAGYRKQKLEAQIQRIVGDVLLTEIKDPRVGFVSVTGVNMSKDDSYADVMVSVIGDDKDVKKSLMGLESARKYIQYRVGKSIQLRVLPQIRFHIDTSIKEGVEMVARLEQIQKDQIASHENDDPTGENTDPEDTASD